MAKTKEQKIQIINNLKNKLARKKAIVLLNFKGLKVEESEELRKLLREKQIDLTVTKNTLLKIILNEKGITVAHDILSQPLALAFSYDDEVVISKEIFLFAKEHEVLGILGGILDEGFVSAEVIEKLAKLPSREELLAKAVGSIASPLSGLVNVLSGNIRGLVNVLMQYKTQQETK